MHQILSGLTTPTGTERALLQRCMRFFSRHPLLVLRPQEFPRRGDHFAPHHLEIALDERAGRSRVTATSELLGKLVHVYVARAPERDLHLVVAQIPEEDGQARTADRARMLRNPLQILRAEAV